MLTRRRARGGRMQHYYVRPVRYTLSGGGTDSEQWGSRLAGLAFMLVAAILLERPVREGLGAGAQALSGAGSISALSAVGLGYWENWLAGGALMLIGVGIVMGFKWGHFAGMVAALGFLPSIPFGTVCGCVLIFVLWRCYRTASWSPGFLSRIVKSS